MGSESLKKYQTAPASQQVCLSKKIICSHLKNKLQHTGPDALLKLKTCSRYVQIIGLHNKSQMNVIKLKNINTLYINIYEFHNSSTCITHCITTWKVSLLSNWLRKFISKSLGFKKKRLNGMYHCIILKYLVFGIYFGI